jgi:phospholipid/cholesterol/gamma-HCH transport system ATP-binding protein
VDPVAELRDVTRVLSGTKVLDRCSLALERGMIHALVGAGGSGKTLILKTLATLLRPDQGDLRLFGQTVEHDDATALRAVRGRLGVQFQNLALFDFLTVADNVAFPIAGGADEPTPEVMARVEEALASVGLGGTGGLRVPELSGGMQRRVAIARAAVSGADLLLFDDPSGGLDPVTTSRIFGLISGVQARTGCTVVIASHDLDRLDRVTHRFHVVDRGTVSYSGTLADGLRHADPGVRTYLGGAA